MKSDLLRNQKIDGMFDNSEQKCGLLYEGIVIEDRILKRKFISLLQ